MNTRTEQDGFGSIEVPADRYWGAQTQRSLENFPIGAERFGRPVIRAFGLVKRAAARSNHELGVLDRELCDLICAAATEVVDGALDDHFPLVVWQTGSGTQSNMNFNEVIANRANELAGGELGSKAPVHPNDHVNLSQSSNDCFPGVMHVAAASELESRLLPVLEELHGALSAKGAEFDDVVKLGRTHLMDATPLTLGMEFSGWAAQIDFARRRIVESKRGLLELALGGTAVGTGLNAPIGFADRVARLLADDTGLPFVSAPNKFMALAGHEAVVDASGALRLLATVCMKVGNDLRLLASGPRAGLAELRLPANEPGSSIMPGKVNPTQVEALTMVAAQVMGNDAAIGVAASGGQLQLNAFKPLLIHALLQSTRLLADACASFRLRCVEGIEADREVIARHVDRSLMLVTALVPTLGYDLATKVARHAHAEGVSLREAALALGVMSGEDFDRQVQPRRMLGPSGDPDEGGRPEA